LTEGPYFMWAADDDRWHPSYISRCVAALESDDSAVMATTSLRFIDEAGGLLDVDYSISDNPDLSSRSIVRRARTLLRRGGWYQIYGISRREALAQTRLGQEIYGSDVVLILELALRGPILKIPEVLFWYRQYGSRTEEIRAQRQGMIPAESRVLGAKYTYLADALSGAIGIAALPRSLKAILSAEVWRAAYMEDTPLSRGARREINQRIRYALADRDLMSLVRFTALAALVGLERGAQWAKTRVGRLRR
jgi:hypothetical protein